MNSSYVDQRKEKVRRLWQEGQYDLMEARARMDGEKK